MYEVAITTSSRENGLKRENGHGIMPIKVGEERKRLACKNASTLRSTQALVASRFLEVTNIGKEEYCHIEDIRGLLFP